MSCERFVRSFDGTELFVSDSGEGIPLVLCDGLGCDGFIWRRLMPAFADRYRIVRWHYRGHGLSRAPADPDALDISALRNDLLHVLDALGIREAVLAGHSMGCQVILDFGVTHPDRTLGLLPMCGSYGRPLDTFHDNGVAATVFPVIRDAVLRWPGLAQGVWRMTVGSELAYRFATTLEVNGRLVRQKDFRPYFRHMSGMDVGIFMRLVDRIQHHSVEEELSRIKAPTLVIAGEHDTFTPVWLSRRMQELIPDAELLVVPSGTHIAPLEIPELVHLRVERFLNDKVAPLASQQKSKKATPAKIVAKKERRRTATASTRRRKA